MLSRKLNPNYPCSSEGFQKGPRDMAEFNVSQGSRERCICCPNPLILSCQSCKSPQHYPFRLCPGPDQGALEPITGPGHPSGPDFQYFYFGAVLRLLTPGSVLREDSRRGSEGPMASWRSNPGSRLHVRLWHASSGSDLG